MWHLVLERRGGMGYTACLHKEEATLPTSCLLGAEVRPYEERCSRELRLCVWKAVAAPLFCGG